MDWRCSCLCSWLIPSVTERSVLFVKELSFPQIAPTDDVFFQSNWAGACWGRWVGTRVTVDWSEGSGLSGKIGLLLGWSAGTGCGTPLQRQERIRVGGGFARGRSDA